MISWRGLLLNMVALAVVCLLAAAMFEALTSAEYQRGLTTRYEARETTRQVQAEQWGDTLRTWGQAAATAGSVLVVVGGAVGVLVVWQRERTKRHAMTQTHTTQRVLISAQRDVVVAYINAFGGRAGTLGGVRGVYLDATREFIPWQVARAELDAARLLPPPG